MLSPGSVIGFTPHASFRAMGDGAVVLLADSGQLYTCNETAEAFLGKVDGVRTLGEIIGLMCEEFDVDAETAGSDFTALANDLLSETIIRVDA